MVNNYSQNILWVLLLEAGQRICSEENLWGRQALLARASRTSLRCPQHMLDEPNSSSRARAHKTFPTHLQHFATNMQQVFWIFLNSKLRLHSLCLCSTHSVPTWPNATSAANANPRAKEAQHQQTRGSKQKSRVPDSLSMSWSFPALS